MQTAKKISISLPVELFTKSQALVENRRCGISEVLGEALRRYLAYDEEWKALLSRAPALGKEMNITSEADVERLADSR